MKLVCLWLLLLITIPIAALALVCLVLLRGWLRLFNHLTGPAVAMWALTGLERTLGVVHGRQGAPP